MSEDLTGTGPTGKPLCPHCGIEMDYIYDPPVQEYPGAAVWSGSSYYECSKCGHETDVKKIPFPEDNIKENTRGW